MKKIAIIGAGLAGSACAYVLQQNGYDPVIYEAGDHIAPGASGNDTGLYNPRLAANLTPESLYFKSAFDLACNTFPNLPDIDWHRCGALHLMQDEKRELRFRQAVKNWNWPPEKMKLLSAGEASNIAGHDLAHEALYLPAAGTLSPRKLCAAYAKDIEIHYNQAIDNIDRVPHDAVILACGMAVKNFSSASFLPLQSVRGQITYIRTQAQISALKCNLCYGGYLTPAKGNVHTLGATFQRWLDHDDIMPEDDARNLQQLFAAIPALTGEYEIISHQAGLRAATPDHLPVVGQLDKTLFISTGHGSHGIVSSLLAAHIIKDLVRGMIPGLPPAALEKITPARFKG